MKRLQHLLYVLETFVLLCPQRVFHSGVTKQLCLFQNIQDGKQSDDSCLQLVFFHRLPGNYDDFLAVEIGRFPTVAARRYSDSV